MPAWSRLAIAGGLTLVIGLLVFFPARLAYHWFAPPTVKLASIEGSIWRGSATEASAGGIYLRDFRWRLRPFALLTGKLGYAIEARPASGFLEGNVAIGLLGAVSASDLNVSMPLQSLQQAVQMPGLGGNLSMQISDVRLEDGLPVAADGVVEVANLVLPIVHRFSIGGYRAEFFTEDSGLMASVEDVDGSVDLAGSLRVSVDRTYQFVAQLAPKDNTPPNLRQQMQFLGSPNDRGQHELRLEGQL